MIHGVFIEEVSFLPYIFRTSMTANILVRLSMNTAYSFSPLNITIKNKTSSKIESTENISLFTPFCVFFFPSSV